MPTTLDKEMRSAATELISEVGATVKVYPPVTTTFNVSSGKLDVTDSTGVSVKASPPIPMKREFAEERPGVVMTDKIMFFDAKTLDGLSVSPSVEGSVEHDGERRPIIAVTELWSGEQIAAYQVALRY